MAKFIMYPSGDTSLPSSHLRIFETVKELEKLGHDITVVDSNMSDDNKKVYLSIAPPGCIVYVQKIAQRFHNPKNFIPFKNKFHIVYDVDDFHNGADNGMISLAKTVVAGSHYVSDYAKQLNSNVHVACSITDTDIYDYVDRSDRDEKAPIKIFWTENFANAYLEDLKLIEKPMQKMYQKYGIQFVLQGLRENRILKSKYKNLIVEFIKTFPYAYIQKFMPIEKYLTEGVQTMKDADIGIIPFKADRVGKAGQNMRSLMSTGLACIGTPGNEHEHIIEHGKTGFLASSSKEWEFHLEKLILDKQLRLRMGKEASKHIKKTYSREQYIKRICNILNL